MAGWLQMWWAVVLHRTVAKKERWHLWQARRNLAMCRAERRGVSVQVMAARLGLKETTVQRKVSNGKKVEREGVQAVEEDAA